MIDDPSISTTGHSRWRWACALSVWSIAWVIMVYFEGRIGLDQVAITLVFASALAAIWLPLVSSLTTTALAVLAFDWFLVPPKYTLRVDLTEDVLLLVEVLALSWVVSILLEQGRVLANRARRSARHAEQMRVLGDALRVAEDPLQRGEALRGALMDLLGGDTKLLLRGDTTSDEDAKTTVTTGMPNDEELAAMWFCTRLGKPFGRGTDREPARPALCLPLRGGEGEAFGAAMIAVGPKSTIDPIDLTQAQALCDQMGQLLQRAKTQREADAARALAQGQAVRNALLAAISHDYRTPLAAIMGAASSLRDVGKKLAPEQRERLAETIVTETRQLSRLTDNTLQLVRLDTPGLKLHVDWESADDLAGAAIGRARKHAPDRCLKVWTEPGLPLIRCDAMLFSQMLENLIDNALKYSQAQDQVDLIVRKQGVHIVFAVRDRGPGIEPAWREKIFDVFQRGDWRSSDAIHANSAAQRGAGVGLAVCRAIARAHGGELKLRQRGHGGSSFECWLPEEEAPQVEENHAAMSGAGT